MIVLWSPEAIADIASLRAYIAEDNPDAANRIALHIGHNVEQLLSSHPEMGRPGRVPGTRELVIPTTPYVVVYRCATIAFRCCASIMARDDGRIAFDASEAHCGGLIWKGGYAALTRFRNPGT